MLRLTFYRSFLLSTLLAGSLLTVPAAVDAAGHRPPSVAPLLSAAVPRLQTSNIPVYLPSWLPHYQGRQFIQVTLTNHHRAFLVELCSDPACRGDASIDLLISGRLGSADPVGRRIALGRGRVGHLDLHIGGNEGPTLSWQTGPFSYEIGYMSSVHQLIRAARSAVSIP